MFDVRRSKFNVSVSQFLGFRLGLYPSEKDVAPLAPVHPAADATIHYDSVPHDSVIHVAAPPCRYTACSTPRRPTEAAVFRVFRLVRGSAELRHCFCQTNPTSHEPTGRTARFWSAARSAALWSHDPRQHGSLSSHTRTAELAFRTPRRWRDHPGPGRFMAATRVWSIVEPFHDPKRSVVLRDDPGPHVAKRTQIHLPSSAFDHPVQCALRSSAKVARPTIYATTPLFGSGAFRSCFKLPAKPCFRQTNPNQALPVVWVMVTWVTPPEPGCTEPAPSG
jgi:hypothetical protein